MNTNHSFSQFYQQKKVRNLYPTEFVIRILLGSYPNLNLNKQTYPGSKILDLGFGDGRNFPLLDDLDMEIHGCEMDQAMLDAAKNRFKQMNLRLSLGSNSSIPYDTNYFDYILACHSCYYISPNETFAHNLKEIARVLKPNAHFIFSLPRTDNFILHDAVAMDDGHYQIQNDPYGLRNGVLFKAFSTADEIQQSFAQHFKDLRIGSSVNDYFGRLVSAWIGVATRI
jgi:SAM-dependent methyltransferase